MEEGQMKPNNATPQANESPEARGEEEVKAQEQVNEVQVLRQELEQSRAQADYWLDQYRRSAAEFANYRKRQERDQEQQLVRLKVQVLKKLLPSLDDLQRALRQAPDGIQGTPWFEGILLIERKLQGILEEFQVQPIEALGKPFDPHYHEALLQEESDVYPAGTVMEELQKGYLLADHVVRPTLVKVSNGPGPQKEPKAS